MKPFNSPELSFHTSIQRSSAHFTSSHELMNSLLSNELVPMKTKEPVNFTSSLNTRNHTSLTNSCKPYKFLEYSCSPCLPVNSTSSHDCFLNSLLCDELVPVHKIFSVNFTMFSVLLEILRPSWVLTNLINSTSFYDPHEFLQTPWVYLNFSSET